MRKDSQKRKALQERRFRAELFLLVRVRFILLFYLDDVIIQIADEEWCHLQSRNTSELHHPSELT